MLEDGHTFVHTICALAFPDVFLLKDVVTMKFYLDNKKALFDSMEAHRTLYGDVGLTNEYAKRENQKCFVCGKS